MFQIKSAARLSLTIGMICVSLLWFAVGVGIVPNPFQPKIDGRIALTRSVAISVAQFAESSRFREMQNVLNGIERADDQLVSVGVKRTSDQRYVVQAGDHEKNWVPLIGEELTDSQIAVTIYCNGSKWGKLELMFEPLEMNGVAGLLNFPLPLIGFISASLILISWHVFGKTFRYLNPTEVVPTRVKSAFDTLAEGLMLVNPRGEIAHANLAMSDVIGIDSSDLVGMNINEIEWQNDEVATEIELPWNRCLKFGVSVVGQIVELSCDNKRRKYIVNATAISGSETGKTKGVLISLDDVTALENKKSELSKIIQTLRRSRDEVERQNEQLNFLASYDPMTKCMNRRAFWFNYEQLWEDVEPAKLSITMVDVDHFKSINDTYGHSVGDEVLIGVGDILQKVVGNNGLVCRYGGEEFAILIPNESFEFAVEVAEQIRLALSADKIANIDVTASLGVSNRKLGAMDPQHMLDQADECLYAAKKSGRNRVVGFDQCSKIESEIAAAVPDVEESPIQYSAVTGLLSALSFKSQETAQHSLRVADLAVNVGRKLLNRRELYKLEIAALLHDIGKIGVPDAILNKPGALTDDEWEIMARHDEIGVEIVRSAFASDSIAGIIACHNSAMQTGSSDSSEQSVPYAANIIRVCDAFDSIVSGSLYRKGLDHERAFEELRKCCPDQFDPQVVELLIAHVRTAGYDRNRDELPIDTRTAVSIGQHIEDLCDAIELADVDKLQEVVASLKDNAINNQLKPMTDVTVKLNDAIINEESVESVLELADEVLNMCRSSRSAFVDSSETTASV
ncbi:MAG: diguanylate cyclase [Planctomycetota bacterium]